MHSTSIFLIRCLLSPAAVVVLLAVAAGLLADLVVLEALAAAAMVAAVGLPADLVVLEALPSAMVGLVGLPADLVVLEARLLVAAEVVGLLADLVVLEAVAVPVVPEALAAAVAASQNSEMPSESSFRTCLLTANTRDGDIQLRP
jgi:hypothetical protein